MNYNYKRIWILTISTYIYVLKPANVQFAMPVYPPPPPPIYPVPAISFMAPALLPVVVPLPDEALSKSTTESTTTTTTTKRPEEQVAIAIPVPVPLPMALPMAVPSFPPAACQRPPPRPNNCPPCPPCQCKPSCTPSFFSYCSPCHLKCRCRRREETPEPLPSQASGPGYAIQIGPPPVVVVPFPPPRHGRPPRRRPKSDSSSCSEESSESSSSESNYLRKRKTLKKKKRKTAKPYRRSPRSSENENEFVKPMLSYISKDGDVKFEAKISNDDAAQLLGERPDKYQTVQVTTGEDGTNKQQVLVLSENEERRRRISKRHKKVYLKDGISNQVLGDGRKELIFRPPRDKTISNLSVSFQII